jgi:DNA replication ATP-dependent helicase Dna2
MLEQEFDVAVVDEAGQLTEPGTLAAINLADRFVLVGDHQQLPPVVRAENELQASLFERLIEAYPEASVMLDRQYRMCQRVQWLSSEEFYDGQLRPATPEVAGQSLTDLGVDIEALPAELRDPVRFVDPDGHQVGNTNPTEADRVAEIVEAYVAAGVPREEIGVIAPFRAQVAEISKRLLDTTVDTVDRFQGSAKEVIVVSFVASGDLEGPIFEDHRRMNVALSRAKKALTLVGDAEALSTDPFYERLLRWASA